ncbi:type II toxin-antitoxin system RelE family toxin [Athalassotoga sp.]|uniref:type II toxin-antitoxin system RelE family toxin n=1 Tax=Athalassotoga sp. TaxID=2022597 RepID=UPI003D01218C
MEFEIFYAKSVKKDILRIDRKDLTKIKEQIELLKYFPNLPNLKKLSSHPLADYRLRVGNYRVLFDVDWKKKKIYILKIGTRENIY